MSHPHVHCARGAVIMQKIGAKQAQPPCTLGIIDLAYAKSLRKLGIRACNRNTAFLHINLHYIE